MSLVKTLPFNKFELSVAMRYIGATKKGSGISLISIIAFVGIFLSVAVLIIVMSVMQGFRNQLFTQLIGTNGHITIEFPVYGINKSSYTELNNSKRLAATIESLEEVKRAVPLVQAPVYASGLNETAAIIRGIPSQALKKFDFLNQNGLLLGDLVNFGSGKNGGNVIAIGEGLAKALHVEIGDFITLVTARGEPTPFGVTFGKKSYKIGGVFSTGISEYDKALIYMPLKQSMIFFRQDYVPSIDVRLYNNDLKELEKTKNKIQDMIKDDVSLLDWTQTNASYFNALNTERRVMRIILSLIVALAAMNIITGLIMQVKDKRKDIAILRTIGVTRGGIMRIFFCSGLIIGVVGVIFGILSGVIFVINISSIENFLSNLFGFRLFDPDVYQLYQIPAKLDWNEVFFVSVLTLLTSIISTIYPSWRASTLDPVDGLHNE